VETKERRLPDWLVRLFATESGRARLAGAILATLGVGVGVWAAYHTGGNKPLSGGEAAALVLVAATLNIAGGIAFGRVGRAQPQHARSAVRQLLALGRTLRRATERLQQCLASDDDTEIRIAAEVVSESISSCEIQVRNAISDWNEVHRDALREVVIEEYQLSGRKEQDAR
jgi:hypothetical protein